MIVGEVREKTWGTMGKLVSVKFQFPQTYTITIGEEVRRVTDSLIGVMEFFMGEGRVYIPTLAGGIIADLARLNPEL